MDYPHTLPTYLEWQRSIRGLGKRAFAAQLGISHTIYVKLTTTGKHVPLNQTLITLAHGLGLSLMQVMILAGFDLGLPMSLIATANDPHMLRVINRLWQAPPNERAALAERWLAGSG